MIKVGVSLLTALLQDPRVRQATLTAVETLRASDLSRGREVHIVCLDNGSVGTEADDVLACVGRHGTVIRMDANIGIAAGRNAVLRRLLEICPDLDYVVEIHNDHIFPSAWADRLFAYMTGHGEVAAIGPGLLTARGDFGSPAIRLDYASQPSALGRQVDEFAAVVRARYDDAVPRLRRGLSHPVVKRLCALRRAGLFYDEVYAGQNFEDTDEVRRLEAAGYTVGIYLGAWVYHHYNLSRLRLDDPNRAYRRNLDRFRKRWPDADAWLRQWERDLQRAYAHREAWRSLFRRPHPAERHPAGVRLASLRTAAAARVYALAYAARRHVLGAADDMDPA
jgi:GT2 family glycosyltransferase